MQSPFFDLTSNNAALRTQAQFNPAMVYLLQSREAFEERLRTMQGLEFMVVNQTGAGSGFTTGVWNVRKQNRHKRPGLEDEILILGTYFIIGENIYQAPALADVISSKLVSLRYACLIVKYQWKTLPS